MDKLNETLVAAFRDRADYIEWQGVVDFVLSEIAKTHVIVPRDRAAWPPIDPEYDEPDGVRECPACGAWRNPDGPFGNDDWAASQ